MKTWRYSAGFDRCVSCGKGLVSGPTRCQPTRARELVPVLEVTFAGTPHKAVYCRDCAKRVFSERGRTEAGDVVVVREEVPPAVLPPTAPTLRPPAPPLPLDVTPSHQGFVTPGELSRRAWGKHHAIANAKAREERRALATAAGIVEREPGEDDDA